MCNGLPRCTLQPQVWSSPHRKSLLVQWLEGGGAKKRRVLIMPRYLIVIRVKFHVVSLTPQHSRLSMVRLHSGRSCGWSFRQRLYGQTWLSIRSCLQMAGVSGVYTGLALHNVRSQRLSCGSDYALSGQAFLLVSLKLNHISWL